MHIQLFGDSISVGQFVSIHVTWPQLLAQALNETNGDPGWTVSLSAVNGRTTREALLDMPYQVLSHPPDVLLVQFGLNDCNVWESAHGIPRVSCDSFEANLAEMVERSLAAGVSKVFLLTPHKTLRVEPWPHAPDWSLELSRRDYADRIRSLSNRFGTLDEVSIIDIETLFDDTHVETGATVLPLPDGLHLSIAGHELYAQVVLNQLQLHFETLTEPQSVTRGT